MTGQAAGERRKVLGAACAAGLLYAAAQVALQLPGDGFTANLVLNLLVDLALLAVVRFPRVVGVLTVLATAALTLTTDAVATPLAAPLVVSFLVYTLPWRQALAYAGALAVLAIPIWSPTLASLSLALSATALPALPSGRGGSSGRLARGFRGRGGPGGGGGFGGFRARGGFGGLEGGSGSRGFRGVAPVRVGLPGLGGRIRRTPVGSS
ncbi:hypothetical protein [Nonomuraea typhae]|uniref:hypothetical protein n=1 Tax=Nonomuraea typhae TaxID=2603600 RepID=UPI001CA481D1|nr:hypothetical protein [Nonomuraea typhae]